MEWLQLEEWGSTACARPLLSSTCGIIRDPWAGSHWRGSAGVTGVRTGPGAQEWTGACSHSSAICCFLLQPPKPSYIHLTHFFSNLNVVCFVWFFFVPPKGNEIVTRKKIGVAGRTHLAQESSGCEDCGACLGLVLPLSLCPFGKLFTRHCWVCSLLFPSWIS